VEAVTLSSVPTEKTKMHLSDTPILPIIYFVQINIANPSTGAQKKIEIDDDSKL
jgi:hypothetical protein